MSHESNRAQKRTYEPPHVTTFSLRPEEAVLTHSKISGGSGPIAPSCNLVIVPCSSIGS